MTSPRISVALCTFNGARYLQAQLESIALQTLPPDELLICDDASTDETAQMADAFALESKFPVRVILGSERLGPAGNFAKAIEACRGEIIVLSDQDDRWRPHKAESLVRAFQQNPSAAYAFSDAMMVDQAGQPLGQRLWEAVRLRERIGEFHGARQVEILLRHNLIPGAAMAFRAAFRAVILPLPAGWMHDYWIALLGSVLSYGVPVDDVLFDYRRHGDQACGWRKKTFAQVFADSLHAGAQESWRKLELFRHARSRVLAVSGSTAPIKDRVSLLEEKEAHLLRRAAARSAAGPSRVIDVLTEVRTGRYRRFSSSWYSVIRDLQGSAGQQ
jgi:glycosyltransferase involved in cell wall biosynthesis